MLESAHNPQHLSRELDRAKSTVFTINRNAAFLGSLMCSLEIVWDESVPTAATDAQKLWWNPEWFLSLSPDCRATVLLHEIWHVARLHNLRRGERNAQIWNYAADIRINNDLENEGFSFVDMPWAWKDQSYAGWAEEDIYDDLIARGIKPPPGPFDPNRPGKGDLQESGGQSVQAQIGTVVRAMQQARLCNEAGSLPGDVEELVNKFLTPIVPWETLLRKFFLDLQDTNRTWARPNRRYPDMYLPSTEKDDGRLEHLIYYLDVSGSITSNEVLRFNSEVKFIKEEFRPKKLTLVQFDTRITQETVFEEDDPFEELVIVGRGGTCLVPVREHIHEHQPTAAVIFTDLCVEPMQPLNYDLPVVWIAVNNPGASVPFGQLIHIKA